MLACVSAIKCGGALDAAQGFSEARVELSATMTAVGGCAPGTLSDFSISARSRGDPGND